MWKNLDRLDIGDNRIGDKGAMMIGRNPTWKRLEYLNLGANQIGFRGQVALVRNPVWRWINKLDLRSNSKSIWKPTLERINALKTIDKMNPKRIRNYVPPSETVIYEFPLNIEELNMSEVSSSYNVSTNHLIWTAIKFVNQFKV